MTRCDPLAVALVATVSVAGCGGGGDDASGGSGSTGPEAACSDASAKDGSDDRCHPAGLPEDMECPPGETASADGCVAAGVPPDGCAAGFVFDGDGACDPILPAEPCSAGLMAVPGETACRPVAPCADGTWGDIPVGADTQFVNAAYAGPDSDGTEQRPWKAIAEGIAASAPGAIVAVASGTYVEDLGVSGTPVRLWGRCPQEVEIVGSGAALAAVFVGKGASGSELRGVAVTGSGFGLIVTGSTDVVADRVWIHDTTDRGIHLEDSLGDASLALQGSLVEGAGLSGVSVISSSVTLSASVVRETQSEHGLAIQTFDGSNARGELTVEGSVVERNGGGGVFVVRGDATIRGSVVRDSRGDETGRAGRGIDVEDDAETGIPSTLHVQQSVIEQSREIGVFIGGSEALLEATVVRETLAADAPLGGGRGIEAASDPVSKTRSNVTLRASVVERSHAIGINVIDSDVALESTVVRDTQPDAAGAVGWGINARRDIEGASLGLVRSVITRNREVGVLIAGSDATIEASVIRETAPNDGAQFGRGLQIEAHPFTRVPSSALVRASLLEHNHEVSVLVLGSAATIESSVVRETQPNGEGRLGDGIALLSDLAATTATLDRVRLEGNARAGLSSFGAVATLGSTLLGCNAFDLEGEAFDGQPFSFTSLEGNVCGCPPSSECQVLSASLEPPSHLPAR